MIDMDFKSDFSEEYFMMDSLSVDELKIAERISYNIQQNIYQ